MRATERQRHAIVLVYEAMMRELTSIFARHKALLASLSTARPAPTAKTNGVRLVGAMSPQCQRSLALR